MTLPNLVGPWVDVRSFAPPETPRDGNAPWHEYIQAAVDYLVGLNIPQGPVGTLYFPPGRYRIDQPIQISKVYKGVYAFCSINIIGDAPSYGSDQFHGSAILPSYSDKPAIIIQCGRSRPDRESGHHREEHVDERAEGDDRHPVRRQQLSRQGCHR
jgi:hypothetical protein